MIESIVLAAVDAAEGLTATPATRQSVRDILRAGFSRAHGPGLTIEEVHLALESPPVTKVMPPKKRDAGATHGEPLRWLSMFIGHFAVGFASKRLAPRASLGPLLAAPLFLDLVWPIFVLLGVERVRVEPGNTAFTSLAFDSYPWSHSLATSVGWALACAAAYYAITRYRAGAIVIAAGVVSHWVLDWVSHRSDLPLFPGDASPLVGLGLWRSVPATIAVETSMFAAGVALYVTMTRPRDGVGRWSLAALVGLLTVIYIANLLAPPPPSAAAVAATALGLWLFPFWAWWVDAHRGLATGAAT